MTWRPVRHDTEPSAPRHGAVRVAWAQYARSQDPGCAHYAPNLVLTWCTVYSHYFDHCSWTLFLNNVHGVFFLKIKIKKIKIK